MKSYTKHNKREKFSVAELQPIPFSLDYSKI